MQGLDKGLHAQVDYYIKMTGSSKSPYSPWSTWPSFAKKRFVVWPHGIAIHLIWLKKFRQIWRQGTDGRRVIYQHQYFENESVLNGKPVQITENMCDVIFWLGTSNNPGSYILYALKTIYLQYRLTIKEWIPHIKTWSDISTHALFSSILCKVFPNECKSA